MELISTFFNAQVMRDALPALLNGLGMTIVLGAVSLACAFAMGLALALLRLYGPRWFRPVVVAYVDLFRAMPLLVLLILVYYALPYVGIRLSAFTAAAAALSVVAAAYAAEVFRAGIQAVPRGQVEAAHALGLSWGETMRDVVLPQSLRLTVPPLTGIAISLIKDTALASVVAMPDLLKQATQAQAFHASPTPLIGAAALYLLLLLPLVRFVGYLENRPHAGR